MHPSNPNANFVCRAGSSVGAVVSNDNPPKKKILWKKFKSKKFVKNIRWGKWLHEDLLAYVVGM